MLAFEEQRACFQSTKGWICFKKAMNAPTILAAEMTNTGEVTRVSKFEHIIVSQPISKPLPPGQYLSRISSQRTLNIVVFPSTGSTQQVAFSNSYTGAKFVTALMPSECAGLPCFVAIGNLDNHLCRYISEYDYRLEIVPVDDITLYVTSYAPKSISSQCAIQHYVRSDLVFTKNTGS